MKWIASLLIIGVLSAASYAQVYDWTLFRRCAPPATRGISIMTPWAQVQVAPQIQLQAMPVQPAPQTITVNVPSVLNVQTVMPSTTLRWGFLRRRLIPRNSYQQGPTLQYSLQTNQQPPGGGPSVDQ